MCCNFIWIVNLRGISYHKIASFAGTPFIYSPWSLGSSKMRSPCRMAFPFLLMPFWGLPCFFLFPCLFFTLPFPLLCLSCLCSLSLRTLLPDTDFLWLSEFNFHFLKLIHLLIIQIWRLGARAKKKIPSRLAKIKRLCIHHLSMFPLVLESCILWKSCDTGEWTFKKEKWAILYQPHSCFPGLGCDWDQGIGETHSTYQMLLLYVHNI